MITTIVNVCSTPVSFYTIERYGRRPLLIYGALAMAICEFVIAGVWTADAKSPAANYCLIVFVCVYIFFFASTWGPAAWVVIGEIFQLPIRAKGVALSTASNWFWNCIIAIIVPYMVDPNEGNLGGRVFFVSKFLTRYNVLAADESSRSGVQHAPSVPYSPGFSSQKQRVLPSSKWIR